MRDSVYGIPCRIGISEFRSLLRSAITLFAVIALNASPVPVSFVYDANRRLPVETEDSVKNAYNAPHSRSYSVLSLGGII